ncbi:hypothetical protein DSM112329_00889 [Paraconexibacter sp. AEG42_29]|uniref:Mce/MlaD domain-containing protein n=1 Tax=Paraconexibacter sp. AEG42_29 TaxID=2997339 RepID=A0AAU7AR61_9ACTN
MRVDNLRLKVMALIGFVIICMALFLYLFTSAGGRLRVNSPYTVSTLVPDALNIVNNSDVRKDGIRIGRVRSIEPEGDISKIKFEIEKKGQDVVFKDATIRVRTKTLVGESYLDIEPGTPASGKLADGSTIPLDQSKEVVPLERILSSFDAKTRNEVRRNLRGIGVGLDGDGQNLNKLFGTINPVVDNGVRLGNILQPQRKQLAALIGNTGVVLEALGERTEAFRSLVRDARSTADAVVDRDDKLRESLQELPATLDRAKSSVNKLASFSTSATPVFRSLKISSRSLSPAITDLGPAAKSARTLFRELRPFLDKADPLLSELSPASKKLRTIISPLDAFLRQVDPTANYLKDYNDELGAFFANVGAAVSAKDAYGYRARAFGVFGLDAISSLTPAQGKILQALTSTATFGNLTPGKYNPYPKPGKLDPIEPFDGNYPQVQAAK